MRTLIVHGRQPALGRAELESLYGSDVLKPAGNTATLIDMDPPEINFMRLGGMVKFCKVLTILDTTNWGEIQKFLEEAVPGHATNLQDGKLRLGLSSYGLDVNPKRLMATGLSLKKLIRATGRSVRFVPNVETDLNAAQVLHNKLTQKLGWELVFVRSGDKTIVAQSIAVQDIEMYARRDQQRPFRDARVGMLPPKLAQIIINLAIDSSKQQVVSSKLSVLDPFCGSGVILQEAMMMNYPAYGTDLEPRMVEYSRKNLDWLTDNFRLPLTCPDGLPEPAKNKPQYEVAVGDATNYQWPLEFGAVASETYLGRALSSLPDPRTLRKIISDVDTIHAKFLRNLARQTKPGFRACLAVPAWAVPPNSNAEGFLHLPTLDKLNELGYNRLKFVHAAKEDLIYHRPSQIVGRELVVLQRR